MKAQKTKFEKAKARCRKGESLGICPNHGEFAVCKKFKGVWRCVDCGEIVK